MLRAKLTAFSSALIFAGTVFSHQQVCPELHAIQTEGLSMSMEIYGIYAAYQISNFETKYAWGFVIAPVDANSEDELIDNANTILRQMSASGVELHPGVCNYETGVPNVYALAIQDKFPTPLKLKYSIRPN